MNNHLTWNKSKKNRFVTIALVLISTSFIFISNGHAENQQEDHEALRNLLKRSTVALNSGDIESLRAFALPDVHVITAEQHASNNFDDFKTYYNTLFNSPESRLSSITFQPTVDELTKFIGPDVGIVSGTSEDTYKFKDGDVRTMTSRWTATLAKDAGQWKIANFHFGVNFMNNPILDALKSFAAKVGVGCALVGFLLGTLLAKRCSRKCSATGQ